MPQVPPQTDTYNTALDIFDRTHPLRVDVDENLKVTVTGGGGVTIGTVNQGTAGTSPWPVLAINTLIPVVYDYIALSPTGTNPTTIVYKAGGSGGTTVATVTLTYDGNNNVQTVTRT